MPKAVYLTPYYDKAFIENKAGSYFVDWNWSAFIFGCGWLAYRKLYLHALGIYFIATVIDLIINMGLFGAYGFSEGTSNLSTLMYLGTSLLLHLFLGLYGTSIYGRSWVHNQVPHSFNESFLGYFFLWLPASSFIVLMLSFATLPMFIK